MYSLEANPFYFEMKSNFKRRRAVGRRDNKGIFNKHVT